jgi:REP element-mobilizing transposase RayT
VGHSSGGSNRCPSTRSKIQPCHWASNAAITLANSTSSPSVVTTVFHTSKTQFQKTPFEQVIEKARQIHDLAIYAYVLMPEHVHLLTNEPEIRSLASFLQVIKGESSKLLKATRETSIPKTGITKNKAKKCAEFSNLKK